MFLPDYQSVTDQKIRHSFTKVWQSDDFSNEKGLTVTEIMDAIHGDSILGMYILGENPAMSDPDVEHAREALAKLDHLVVQDIFLTETANYADVILPASAFYESLGRSQILTGKFKWVVVLSHHQEKLKRIGGLK